MILTFFFFFFFFFFLYKLQGKYVNERYTLEPEPYIFLNCHLNTSDVVVLAKEIYECWLVAEDMILLTRKIIYTYFIVSESIYMWKRGSCGGGGSGGRGWEAGAGGLEANDIYYYLNLNTDTLITFLSFVVIVACLYLSCMSSVMILR